MVRARNKQSFSQALRPLGRAHREPYNHISSTMLHRAAEVATEAHAAALFIYAEALMDLGWTPPRALSDRIIYVLKPSQQRKVRVPPGQRVVHVPEVNLGRLDQIKIAVLAALSRGLLERTDTIACLTGAAGSGEFDTIVVLRIDKEFDLFFLDVTNLHLPPDISPAVLDKAVSLATEMAWEGREGIARGTILVVGDTDRVLSFSKQLILNPFKGYPADERNILDPSLDETVKELAVIDGAFLIQGDGTIETAGTYLKFTSGTDANLPPGLGARHQAAAGITAVTRAIAVTVSQSTGAVSIFRNGAMLMEVERHHGGPR